jgi:hypothetical protein
MPGTSRNIRTLPQSDDSCGDKRKFTIFKKTHPSPSDYKPREAPMSNKEAAAIFDHPEIEKLPDYIVPFNY